MNFLKNIAPFLSTALGMTGPWGALAGGALKMALGTKSSNPDDLALAAAKATPEQIEAIKKAEQDFQVQLKQLDIQTLDEFKQMLELDNQDRASARQMQVQTRSRFPAILSFMVVVGFFGLLTGLMVGRLKASDNQALLLLLGGLNIAFGAVVSYWLGSSAGSDRKTEILAQSTQSGK